VMGMTGAGKTTFINKASGSTLTVGQGLESCTSEVQTAEPFLLDGHVVTLVDSPGFDDTNRSEAEILREVTTFLAKTYENKRLLAGILYLHRITDKRVGGVAKRNFSVFRKLCGESSLKNALVVTNMWSLDATSEVTAEEEAREKQLASNDLFFKRALENGARMMRHDNTTQSAHSIIRQFLANRPQPLQIQRELVDEKKSLAATDAGFHMNEEWKALSERYRKEIEEIRNQQR
ncbi:P-loop containing nucleoside triphosphate hydrolase protein, partial [Cytidiella melzeri]